MPKSHFHFGEFADQSKGLWNHLNNRFISITERVYPVAHLGRDERGHIPVIVVGIGG